MRYIAIPSDQLSPRLLSKITPRPFGPKDYITIYCKKNKNSTPKTEQSQKSKATPKIKASVKVKTQKDGGKIITVSKK